VLCFDLNSSSVSTVTKQVETWSGSKASFCRLRPLLDISCWARWRRWMLSRCARQGLAPIWAMRPPYHGVARGLKARSVSPAYGT